MVEFLIDQALREAIDLHNRNLLDDAKSLYIKIIEHDIILYKRNSGDSKMSFKTLIQIIIFFQIIKRIHI